MLRSPLLCMSLAATLLSACNRDASRTTEAGAPQRIVSVTITGDVLLQALVDSSRILAVSKLADDSGIHESAGLFPSRPRVGPDLERILTLRPDLVLLGSFNDPDFVTAIRNAGVPAEILESPRTLSGIRDFLGRVGARLGSTGKSDSLVRWMDSILADVRTRAQRCPDRPRVAYWSEGFTAGDSSTIHDLLVVAGARNAVAESGRHGSAPLAVEDMVGLDPDWILRTSWEAGGRMKPLPDAFLNLKAVRNGHVAIVPGRILLSTSHRAALGARAVFDALHPDCAARAAAAP